MRVLVIEDEPRIEVVCEGKVIAKIPLTLSLVATLEGVELEIEDAADPRRNS